MKGWGEGKGGHWRVGLGLGCSVVGGGLTGRAFGVYDMCVRRECFGDNLRR